MTPEQMKRLFEENVRRRQRLTRSRMRMGAALGDFGDSSGSGGVSTPPPFTPLSVSPIIWTDVSDMSSLFQDSAGTTAVTAADQPVGRISDKSGNGNHLLQPTAASRGLFRSGSFIDLDGVDDGYDTAAGRVFPATMELFMAVRNVTDTNFMMMYATAESGTGFVGTAASGDASASQGGGFGTPTTYVDGVLLSPDTRGNLLTQVGTTAGKVVEFRGLTTGTKSQLSFYKYSAGFQFLGRAYSLILTPTLTTEQRASIRTYLGAQMGVTL